MTVWTKGPLPVPNCNVENAQERGLLFGYERKRQLSMSVDINEDDLMVIIFLEFSAANSE